MTIGKLPAAISAQWVVSVAMLLVGTGCDDGYAPSAGRTTSSQPAQADRAATATASPIGADAKVRLDWNVPPGLECKVSNAGLMKLSITTHVRMYNQPETAMPDQQDLSWKKRYSDTYKAVKDGRPQRIVRHTEQDSFSSRNPQNNNKMESQDLPTKDSTVMMTVKGDGSVELTDDTDPQVIDEFKKVRLGTLMPQRAVAIGEEWPVNEAQLKACMPLVARGSGKLKLVKVETDSALNQPVAHIAGELKLEYGVPGPDGQILPLNFEGKISIKHLPAMGVEILRKIDGTVSSEQPFQQGAVAGKLTIKGELHETTSAEIQSSRHASAAEP